MLGRQKIFILKTSTEKPAFTGRDGTAKASESPAVDNSLSIPISIQPHRVPLVSSFPALCAGILLLRTGRRTFSRNGARTGISVPNDPRQWFQRPAPRGGGDWRSGAWHGAENVIAFIPPRAMAIRPLPFTAKFCRTMVKIHDLSVALSKFFRALGLKCFFREGRF